MSHLSRRLAATVVPLVAALAVVVSGVPALGQDEPPVTDVLNTDPIAQPARGVIVQLEGASGADVEDLADGVAAHLPEGVGVADVESGPADMGLIELSEQIEARDLDDAIDQLEDLPGVAWAVPNGVRMPSATANDTYYPRQWSLNGAFGVRAEQAWDITTGSSGVRVAVIDTGVRLDHPDLRGRLVAGRDFVDDEYRCVNRACTKVRYRRSFESANDGNGWDASPADPGDWRAESTCDYMGADPSTWHGTHVAGIAAATRNNGIGTAGIAPGAKVQPIRALGRCGGTDWDIAMSVLWAAGVNVSSYDRRHGRIPVNRTPAKVINLSLGALAPTRSAAQQACRVYATVAKRARARGALVVAAAGNNGIDHRLNVPSSCAGYLSVAASTFTGAGADYSNRGIGVDLAAPGGAGFEPGWQSNIVSTWNRGARGPGANGYGYLAGTSMAAPLVAGVAALAQSVGIKDPAVLERVLKATARGTSCSEFRCGAGIVDAQAVLTAKAPLTAPRISGRARPGGTLTATPGRWRNAAAVGITWYRDGTRVGAGPTYRPTRADLGRTIAAVSRAEGGNNAILHRATVVVKSVSRTAVSAPTTVRKSTRVKIRVKVTAPYVRATGTVRVYDGKRRIAVTKIYAKNKGSVSIRLPKLKKGTHTIRVVYAGNGKIFGSTRSRAVRSR